MVTWCKQIDVSFTSNLRRHLVATSRRRRHRLGLDRYLDVGSTWKWYIIHSYA